ncbi:MAG: hypothetical protein ABI351_02775 [Herbaspirillum sp.]
MWSSSHKGDVALAGLTPARRRVVAHEGVCMNVLGLPPAQQHNGRGRA